MLPRFLLSLITVTSSVWPFIPQGSGWAEDRLATLQKSSRAKNVDRETALGSLNHRRPEWAAFCCAPFYLVPGVEWRRLLVREVLM